MTVNDIKFDANGLIPAVVQDFITKKVLTVAYMNKESLDITLNEKRTCFWSRSRKELWRKGETSGNTMKVRALLIDCDGDTLLAEVDPTGPACHTGERSCFYRTIMGKSATESTFLGRLWRFLDKRKYDSPKVSYTARLLSSGKARVAQKVGEEGVETAIAAALGDRENFRCEAADLLYHLLAACISTEVPISEVLSELESRHRGR